MVLEVKEYYNIVEPFVEGYDVGSYLFENKISYDMRSTTKLEAEIDLAWMATITHKSFIVYTVRLSEDEVLFLKLRFSNLSISKPKSPEKIADMAKRVLL